MATEAASLVAADVLAVTAHYQEAAQDLLLAYQRNKQATRHHRDGAFRAALHHAHMSCEHVAQAHIHLEQALVLSKRLSALSGSSKRMPQGHDMHQGR